MSLRSLAVLALASLVGCSNPYDPHLQKQKQKGQTQTAAQTDVVAGEMVDNILRGLSVNSGSIDYSLTTQQLNENTEQRRAKMAQTSDDLRERIAKTGFANLQAVDSQAFRPTDVAYLADVMFSSTLAQGFRRDGDDELALVRRVFAWVVRNIQLSPPGADAVGTVSHICYRGTGVVGERAWVFLELLRQLDVAGAVVGGMDKPEGEATGAVVAVFGKAPDTATYLFDMEAGFPIPAGPGGAKPISTFSEVLASPGYWRKLRGLPEKAPAPKVSLLLAVDGEALSSRMALVQGMLSNETKCIVATDWEAWKARATAALAGVPGNAGVGGWALPSRSRGALSDQSKRVELNKAMNLYWVVNRDTPRTMHLQGNWNQAARKFINYDFEKTGSQLSLELSGAGLPPDQRQRIETQTRQDIVFFGGASQLDRSEASPSVARTWFERYIKQFGSTDFTPETVRNPGLLCERLVVESKIPGPAKRMWDLLSKEQREQVAASAKHTGAGRGVEGQNAQKFGELLQELTLAVDELASDDHKSADAAAKRTERLTAIQKKIEDALPSVPEQVAAKLLKAAIDRVNADIEEKGANNARRELQQELKQVQQKMSDRQGEAAKAALEARSVLVQVLNELVRKRDFATQADFAGTAPGASEQVKKLFAADRAKLSDEDLQKLNRGLLLAAFGNELDSAANAIWMPNAIRNAAVCAYHEGKRDQAIALLRTDHPALAPVHRAAHAALLRLLESDPKAVVE